MPVFFNNQIKATSLLLRRFLWSSYKSHYKKCLYVGMFITFLVTCIASLIDSVVCGMQYQTYQIIKQSWPDILVYLPSKIDQVAVLMDALHADKNILNVTQVSYISGFFKDNKSTYPVNIFVGDDSLFTFYNRKSCREVFWGPQSSDNASQVMYFFKNKLYKLSLESCDIIHSSQVFTLILHSKNQKSILSNALKQRLLLINSQCISQTIENIKKIDSKIKVMPWYESYPELQANIEFEKVCMKFIFSLLLVLSLTASGGVLCIYFIELLRYLATLRILGLKNFYIKIILIFFASVVMVLPALLGLGVAAIIAFLCEHYKIISFIYSGYALHLSFKVSFVNVCTTLLVHSVVGFMLGVAQARIFRSQCLQKIYKA